MFHTPAAHGDLPANVNGHPIPGAGSPPLGVVGRGAVQGLLALGAVALLGVAGHGGVQAHVVEFLNHDRLGVVVGVRPVDGHLGAFAPLTVAVDGHHFQGHILSRLIPLQGGDVERRVGGLHDQILGAVFVHLVDLVGRRAGHCPPVDPGLGSIRIAVQNPVQGDAGRAAQGGTGPLGEGQPAQVHLVIAEIGFALHLQADGVQNLAGIGRQTHLGGGPVAGAGGQVILYLFAAVIAGGVGVAVVGHQLHQALIALVGQAQVHAVFHGDLGAVEHNVVGLAGRQVAEELQGVAAIVGVAEIISAVQLAAFGINDPGPGGQHVLIGLVAPLGVPGQLAVHIVAPAMAGVEIRDEGGLQNGGLVREKPGHTSPGRFAAVGHVHRGIPRVAGSIDIVGLFGFVEFLTVGGQGHGLVGIVQCQGQAGHAVLIHQQIVSQTVAVDIGLHIEPGEGVKLAPANRPHGVDGGGDLAFSPVIVHEELVDGPGAVLRIGEELLVSVIDRVLVGHAAGGQHGIVPADEHIRPLLVHVAHHFINQGAFGGGATIGLLVEEIAVEAIVIHDFNELVRHGEGSVLVFLQEIPHLLHIPGPGAPGEAQGGHHGHAVGVGSVGELTGGANNQALFRAGPVHKRVGVLPIVKGIGEEIFAALGAGIVMIRVGHGAEHELCLRIGHRVDHEAPHPVSQGDAGPAVHGVGIRLRRPLQQGIYIEGRADGHQGFLIGIGLVHLRAAVVSRRSGQGDGGH